HGGRVGDPAEGALLGGRGGGFRGDDGHQHEGQRDPEREDGEGLPAADRARAEDRPGPRTSHQGGRVLRMPAHNPVIVADGREKTMRGQRTASMTSTTASSSRSTCASWYPPFFGWNATVRTWSMLIGAPFWK